MPDNEISQSGGMARSSSFDAASKIPNASAQSGTRYIVERCPGGGGRAVYALLDMTRIVTHRVICRTNYTDANMIRDALNGAGEEYIESHEALSDLVQLWAEYEALTGGGPGWSVRFRKALEAANELVWREP